MAKITDKDKRLAGLDLDAFRSRLERLEWFESGETQEDPDDTFYSVIKDMIDWLMLAERVKSEGFRDGDYAPLLGMRRSQTAEVRKLLFDVIAEIMDI